MLPFIIMEVRRHTTHLQILTVLGINSTVFNCRLNICVIPGELTVVSFTLTKQGSTLYLNCQFHLCCNVTLNSTQKLKTWLYKYAILYCSSCLERSNASIHIYVQKKELIWDQQGPFSVGCFISLTAVLEWNLLLQYLKAKWWSRNKFHKVYRSIATP